MEFLDYVYFVYHRVAQVSVRPTTTDKQTSANEIALQVQVYCSWLNDTRTNLVDWLIDRKSIIETLSPKLIENNFISEKWSCVRTDGF